jgi:hypothetical protein
MLKVLPGPRCQCNSTPDSYDGHILFFESSNPAYSGQVDKRKISSSAGR